ncbi:MAG: hypothetical protein KC996_09550 [Phycisphaerales bacterium]|nr:hypothetical protein [Phycisphaerales bacterium]
MNTKAIITASLFVSLAASGALAQHADLLLIKDLEGNLLTGQYDFDSAQVVGTGTRVYEGEFDAFGVSDEPGINALSGSNIPTGYAALDGNAAVSFGANAFEINGTVSNLWYWDGTGPVDFSVSANTLTISKAPSSIFSATLDGSGSDVDGFTIETTSSDGFLHKHIDFALSDIDAGSAGFYLWSMDFSVGGSTSEGVYFVHGFGIHNEEAHEAAIDWVSANLVPAPAGVLALLGLPMLAAHRRR